MIRLTGLGPLLLVLALLSGWANMAGAQTSPFGRGAPAAPDQRPAAAAPAEPGVLDRWHAMIRRWQSTLTRSLATEVRAYKEEGSLRPVFALLLISFLYGVAHAVGPGHGKVATAAYFGANRAQAVHGIAMSALIALFQAVSAIAFVGAFALIFRMSQTETVRSVLYVEAASYALIAGVGLWLAWGGIIGRGCSHDHGAGAPAHHKHRHHHAHGDGHHHDVHAHRHEAAASATSVSLASMVPVALASGIRPCTGAILVLLFALSQGIFEIGVLATVLMSAGTFLVVALIGLGVIYARRAASKAGGHNEHLANIAQRAMGLAGGLLVFAFGALFLYSTVTQPAFKL